MLGHTACGAVKGAIDDVVLGNLEDAIPADAKEAARAGFITMAKACHFGFTTRSPVNGAFTGQIAVMARWARR